VAHRHCRYYLGSPAMSKGSRPRPYSIPLDTFNENFDRIFNHGTQWNEKQKAESSSSSATELKVSSESASAQVADSLAPFQAGSTSFTLTGCAAGGSAGTASSKPD
jgi:hypothetical protein